ncbi:MAG: GNAT family N-acetyltransferase [Gemmatales bacterium]|nr:GNAT family N-acetyltransferase [Gemmatales bacterium]MDW8223495.1 GNAT family N-acetyltransferase [Gemmatales bacterium]
MGNEGIRPTEACNDWYVRRATLGDLETIVQFNLALAWESEGKELDQALLRKGVEAVLRDATKGKYFLAQGHEEIVGQIMITWEWSDWRNGWFWWLQSVYVRPEYRRRGVLRSLIRYLAQEALASEKVIGLRLYVEKSNQAAHQAYSRLGLSETSYYVREIYPWPR